VIAAIEKGVLEALRDAGASDLFGYRYRTLETYPDDWDAYLKEVRVLNAPAAWCVFLGIGKMVEEEDGTVRGEARFGLVVAAENLRNEEATRHGHGAKPGSYQLAIDAVTLLAGSDLGLDIGRLKPRQMRLVARDDEQRKRKLSLMLIELATDLPFEAFVDAEPGSFITFNVNWDVPEFGNVGPDIPDDANADATDRVTLEGNDE